MFGIDQAGSRETRAGAAARHSCIVRLGNSPYVLASEMIVDCIELPAGHAAGSDADWLELHDGALPLIRLGEYCASAGWPAKTVVVIGSGRHRAGLVVDRFGGRQQAGIVPLCGPSRRGCGIAGYARLDSGEVAPILDLPELVQRSAGARRPPAGESPVP